MKRFCLLIGLALLVSCNACSRVPFERETAIEKSVDKFHAQMNEEQYQAIYAEADPELRNRISEQDFTKRLADTRARAGRIEGKANVVRESSFRRQLRKLFSGREIVSHVEITRCDVGSVREQFQWSVVDETATLHDYEFRQILERGKIYRIGNGNIAISPN